MGRFNNGGQRGNSRGRGRNNQGFGNVKIKYFILKKN